MIGNGSNGYSEHALMSYRGNSNLENQLETRQRNEEHLGGGASLIWSPERWHIAFDGSYSRSHRTETQKQTRMRSTTRVPYTLTYYGDDVVPTVDFGSFDITNHANFLATANNAAYPRRRFVTDREDVIWAGKLDITREFDKSKWSFARDIEYFDGFPVRHPALLFGARALTRPDWLRIWSGLNPDPAIGEVIRNFPVRQPLLWIDASDTVR